MSTIIRKAQDATSNATRRSQAAIDARWSPNDRARLSNSIRAWTSHNPRLAFFLAVHLALSGPPTLMFLLFSASTMLVSLVTFVITAVLASLAFTGFCIGAALVLLIPTVFVTATIATGLFVWGMVTFWIMQRIAESETPVPYIKEIVRKIESITQSPRQESTSGRKSSAPTNGRLNMVNGTGDSSATSSPIKLEEPSGANMFGILDDTTPAGQKQ